MNQYLQKLHSLERAAKPPNVKMGDPHLPSKLSKPPFEGFDGDRVCARSSLLEHSVAALAMLHAHCPHHVEVDRWRQAIADAESFLSTWSEQADSLGWATRDLFGLPAIPTVPHPSYRRLSRYDETGLVWLLQGRPVVAMTESTAVIQNPAGIITVYRKHNKPALGPVGDSLDDIGG